MEKTSRLGLSIVHSRCLHVCCQVLVVEGPNQHRCSAQVLNVVDVCSVCKSRHHSMMYDLIPEGFLTFARVHFRVSVVAVGFLKRTTSPGWSVPSFLLVRL